MWEKRNDLFVSGSEQQQQQQQVSAVSLHSFGSDALSKLGKQPIGYYSFSFQG